MSPVALEHGPKGMHHHHRTDEQCKHGQSFEPVPPIESFGVRYGPNPGPNPSQLGQNFPLTVASTPSLYPQDGHAKGPKFGVYHPDTTGQGQGQRDTSQKQPGCGPVVVKRIAKSAKTDGHCEHEKHGPLGPLFGQRTRTDGERILRSFRGHGKVSSGASLLEGI